MPKFPLVWQVLDGLIFSLILSFYWRLGDQQKQNSVLILQARHSGWSPQDTFQLEISSGILKLRVHIQKNAEKLHIQIISGAEITVAVSICELPSVSI